MEWGDLNVNDIRSIILLCANCGVITEATKSNKFRCEVCDKFALEVKDERSD